MSFEACIRAAVGAGEMSARRADEARERYRTLAGEYTRTHGKAEGEARAAREAFEEIDRQATARARARLLQVNQLKAIGDALGRQADPAGAVNALIEDLGGKGLGIVSARGQYEALRGQAFGRLDELVMTFRRNLLGQTRNKATQLEVGRESYQTRSGNELARTMNEAWQEVAEWMRGEYVRAGGVVGKLDRWGLPTRHISRLVRAAGRDAWKRTILPLLDRDRMISYASGQRLTDADLDTLLDDVFDTISTDGWNKRTPSTRPIGNPLRTRRADHRHLHFRDFDAWLAYAEKFGDADVFNVQMRHIEGMARDIAAMRTFGPNPEGGLEYIRQWLQKDAALKAAAGGADAERLIEHAAAQGRFLNELYRQFNGDAMMPDRPRTARFMQNTRSFLTAAHLGSAAVSSITDPAFMVATAFHNGMKPHRMLGRLANLYDPTNTADRAIARRAGLLFEDAITLNAAAARFAGEVGGNEFFKRMPDLLFRSTGLSQMTQIRKWAFGMEFMGLLADHANLQFDRLPAPLRKAFEGYGVSAAEWDIARATTLKSDRVGKLLVPTDIADETVATKVLALIESETEFAVPSRSLNGRARLAFGTRPGSIPGEVILSGLMYKNFPVTLAYTHIARAIDKGRSNIPVGLAYASGMMFGATMLGAAALQLKEVSKGNDLRPMTSVEFWIAALMQGGGLGIFGDFLFADVNRFGGGYADTIAGPVVGLASDVGKFTVGNVRQAIKGEDTNIGKEAIDLAQSYTPIASSSWYLRAAYQRLVLDELRRLIDPDASQAYFERAQRNQANRTGTGSWWKPGQRRPDRAPALPGVP